MDFKDKLYLVLFENMNEIIYIVPNGMFEYGGNLLYSGVKYPFIGFSGDYVKVRVNDSVVKIPKNDLDEFKLLTKDNLKKKKNRKVNRPIRGLSA